MESGAQAQPPPLNPAELQHPLQPSQVANEKKKSHRAPSPARPKDVPGWSLTKIRGGIGTPTLSVKPGAIYLGGRVSRRSPATGKDTKAEKSKPAGKPALVVSGAQKSTAKSNKSGRRKVSDSSIGSDDLSRDSGCAPGKLSPTDSSSEISDCASEENKVPTEVLSSDTETSSRGGIEGDKAGAEHGLLDRSERARTSVEKARLSLGIETGEGSISPGDERSLTSFDSRMPASTSFAFSDLTEELIDGVHEELVREIEELRSENEYLKDEMEELRSEMLEMRDMYMEEDVYQLQELRQQLDQANKNCRILQYRLKKAERRSIRVAQTGQVDGELIRALEQDVKVAKDVSIRLHNELDSVEKKRSRLEQENEELRVKLQDLEVAKQVLQAEMEKTREPPEDSSDLKCQLHFAKEESVLMCKKLSKMVKDNEAMKEELGKYRSLYGEVDASLTVEEVADSPHTREAEVKVHLKLVEEEANLLSRRIVELEVDNRGLRAEMDDMKIQESHGGVASHPLLSSSSENLMELQRHLQFVEEEADLLRRSLIEMEEQNKLLMNELNHYKSELPVVTEIEPSPATITSPTIIHDAAVDGGSCLNEATNKELLTARLQIAELNGKVKKLQYENRVLLSNLQRCDLASNQGSGRPALETDAEAGDSAECIPSRAHREGPVGDEQIDILEEKSQKVSGSSHIHTSQCLSIKDLLAIRDQAQLVTSAIQLLTSPDSTILRKITSNESAEPVLLEKSQIQGSTLPLMEALHGRLQSLQAQLHALSERVDNLGQFPEMERLEGISQMPLLSESGDPTDGQVDQITALLKPDSRDQPDCEGKVHPCKAEENDSNRDEETDSKQGTSADLISVQVCELHALLSEANEKAQGAQEALSQERQARHCDTHTLSQLQEEHQKALLRRDFQLQSLSLQTGLQQKLWSQERSLLVQESLQLKESLLLISLKLRWLLKQWRLGKKLDTESKDILEVNSVKDLRLLLEEDGLSAHYGDNKMSAAEEQPLNPTPTEQSLAEKICPLQPSGFGSTLSDLKVALQDLNAEIREERQSSQELTQQFARAKASWEVEWIELKSIIIQLEGKVGKVSTAGGEKDPPDLKEALKKEREEHQHLLADSYAAVMDLTKQLQIGERNWSRERLELLEHFNQERSQWEQRLRDTQSKGTQLPHDKTTAKETSPDAATNSSALQRTKSISALSECMNLLDTSLFLPGHKVSKVQEGNESTAHASLLARTDLSDLNKKNWKYLTNDSAVLEKGDQFKTWDCPSTDSNSTFSGHEEYVQRSYTAPDKTGIRIYYSPPTVRRMERRPVKEKTQQNPQQGFGSRDAAMMDPSDQVPASAPLSSASSSAYEQWLSSLSQQHRDLLEGRSGGSAPFHGLEISGNLSDDMKEMTNCVRQAIRSSSLERKCSKDTASQTVGVSNTGTQTAQFISIGLQTEVPIPTSRGLQGKVWSPRSSTSLVSARSRQISSSLDKVHSRIDRPCCSPKYGSPKLTRRVSTSSSKLETSSVSSRDRSVWNLNTRCGTQSGSAWARSTTTRDSPVLSGLNDGLTSLFSVVEHSGSVESLWKVDPCPGRLPAGKPSCPSIGIGLGEAGAQKYNVVQEFIRNVCSRTGAVGVMDEPKPECLPGTLIGTDNITKIVNKRFMKTQRDELVTNGKDAMSTIPSTLEDLVCDCNSQTPSCFARHSRTTTRHPQGQCRHRVQESSSTTEERLDASNE
ncbi:Protein SOGA1 SOGA family member 1 [Triplophysa tibetana]|uniref:Protein SOGA1 SOGA family member 1 n=1 Tax=Triplophysa tibetana TaxID=1572043 RepID=A0A5A9NDP1_9TELE|nr:Protein SOGA1 SOGA family member 1 [Triplophysa tibetana]